MYGFMKVVTYIGSIIGFFFLMAALRDDSAPRMAATAAVGIGFAVIPYVAARLFGMSWNENRQQEQYKKLVNLLERIAPPKE